MLLFNKQIKVYTNTNTKKCFLATIAVVRKHWYPFWVEKKVVIKGFLDYQYPGAAIYFLKGGGKDSSPSPKIFLLPP